MTALYCNRLIVCGVPQGSVLGPYLYLVYVNDIFNVCEEVKCVLCADDTSIIVTDRGVNSVFNRATCLVFIVLYLVY
jgi:hypothetical protein